MNVIVTANAGQEALGHPAAFPEPLAAYWVKYLTPPGGVVLDPFAGSGTTLAAAKRAGRHWIGIERMPKYARLVRRRLAATPAP
jgi:DNA modification methylase